MADAFSYWIATDFGRALDGHIQAGYKLFPIHGIRDDLSCTCGKTDCKSKGKHPYEKTARNGFLNASGDLALVAEMFEFRTDLNVGVATGEISSIVVLDIDNKDAERGDKALIAIQEVLGPLPETMRLATGNGHHLVFDYPQGHKIKSSSKSFGDAYTGLDVRANGGYIVIHPSRHASGRYYQGPTIGTIADLPGGYIEFLTAQRRDERPVDRQSSSGNRSEWNADAVWKMLEHIHPDDGYDQWIAVGMALHKEGFPLDLWDRWSAAGAKYKGISDLMGHWRSFHAGGERTIGTIIEWASVRGWKPEIVPRAEPEAVATILPLMQKIEKRKKAKTTEVTRSDSSPFSLGFDPLEIPGPLGDTVRWINQYAIYEQPELALLNTLAFAGAVFGRRFCSPLNTRTNLYMVGTGRTGCGKEHSVRMVEMLALHSGLMPFLGSHGVRSDIGILKSLIGKPSQLIMLDEFGMVMKSISDARSSQHYRNIAIAFTKLYSKSSGVYDHGDTADSRSEIRIINPNLCIYGTTTEESYAESLKRSAIKSGELNRYIVIPSTRPLNPRRAVPLPDIDPELAAWWNMFAPNVSSGLGMLANGSTGSPQPMVVEWGECDDFQYALQCDQAAKISSDMPTRDLYSRIFENTVKIAMILAIARTPLEPIIIKQDFKYACSIVNASITYMARLAQDNMAENAQEVNHQDILRTIREAGEAGISRRDLMRGSRRLRKKELEELLAVMIEEEVVSALTIDGKRGRPQVRYYARGDEKEEAA